MSTGKMPPLHDGLYAVKSGANGDGQGTGPGWLAPRCVPADVMGTGCGGCSAAWVGYVFRGFGLAPDQTRGALLTSIWQSTEDADIGGEWRDYG